MIGRSIVVAALLLLFGAWSANAQALPIDQATPAWAMHRDAAALVSDMSVAANLALDTWASWQAPDRRHAFVRQAERDGIVLLSAEITKRLVSRVRPDGSDRLSFFSEHTAFAASAIGGPRLVFTVPLTMLTGYGRIAADRHYLTDTLAGAAVGALAGRLIR